MDVVQICTIVGTAISLLTAGGVWLRSRGRSTAEYTRVAFEGFQSLADDMRAEMKSCQEERQECRRELYNLATEVARLRTTVEGSN